MFVAYYRIGTMALSGYKGGHDLSVEGAPLVRQGEETDTGGVGTEEAIENLFQQYFSEDGYPKIENPAAILSQLESLIQKHNGMVGQEESQEQVDVSKLPGISVHNPLDSIIIGKNTMGGVINETMKHEGSCDAKVLKKRGRGTTSNSPRVKKSSKSSSKYRGVTLHARSGRYEAHIWVKEIQKQMYLGGYEHEEHAAEAYEFVIQVDPCC